MSSSPTFGGSPIGVRHIELAGVAWTVREVRPASARDALEPCVLVFDSGVEQRRLSPAPEGWIRWSDTQLQDACLLAVTHRHLGIHFERSAGG
jgi:hypothetical protein